MDYNSIENILYANKVKNLKDFQNDCQFFETVCNYNKNLSNRLLPMQTKKDIIIFTKKFWLNFYKDHLEYIASYCYNDRGNVYFDNKDKDFAKHRKSINFSSDYEFHLLLKLKTGCWVYFFMTSEITDNFYWGDPDELCIYAHNDITQLIKFGISIKDHKKIGLRISGNLSIEQKITPELIFDTDDCPICIECYDDQYNKKIHLKCGHTFCGKCTVTIIKRNIFEMIRCPICNNFSDIEFFNIETTFNSMKKC